MTLQRLGAAFIRQRAKQALIRTAPVAGLAAPQVKTFLSPETDTSGKAEAAVKQMCEKLLANTVIENYTVELVG